MIIRHLLSTTAVRRASPSTIHRHLLKSRTPTFSSSVLITPSPFPHQFNPPPTTTTARPFASSTSADTVMDSLQEMYATAKDEFEIAAEETEKKTVYAPDDREAARDALHALKAAYQKAVREASPEVAHEVTGRVGQRIRELENAVTAMEESALED